MKICTVNECNNSYYAKGYCEKHYARVRKHGTKSLTWKGRVTGRTRPPEYNVWRKMIERCSNRNNPFFHRYGGRGISVCKRWKDNFDIFYKDMGHRPFPKAKIDRIDNDGNYEPNNCEWVTHKYNCRHTSTTKLSLVIANKIRTVYNKGNTTQKQLGGIYNVASATISKIIRNEIWD